MNSVLCLPHMLGANVLGFRHGITVLPVREFLIRTADHPRISLTIEIDTNQLVSEQTTTSSFHSKLIMNYDTFIDESGLFTETSNDPGDRIIEHFRKEEERGSI